MFNYFHSDTTVVPSTLHAVVIPEPQRPQYPIVLPAPPKPKYPSRVSVNK